LEAAFGVVDDVLRQGIQGISELITEPGLINVDFADVKSIMSEAGAALMAIGRGSGDQRAVEAAKMAIASPLLDISMEGARGVLFNITGGSDLTLTEIHEAADIVARAADAEANIIFGAVIDPHLQNEVKITVIATGFDNGTERGMAGAPARAGGTRVSSDSAQAEPRMPRLESRDQLGDSGFANDRGAGTERYRPAPSGRGERGERESAPSFPPLIDDDDEDLDLPPFLRRRMQRDR
jgi:cell division protein FtsZ